MGDHGYVVTSSNLKVHCAWQEYTAGFYTDIESESLPKGLNEAHGIAWQMPRLDAADSQKCLPFSLGCVLFAIGFADFTGDGFVRTSFEKFGRSRKNRTGCSSIASMPSGHSNSWEMFMKLRRWRGYGRVLDCAYACICHTSLDTFWHKPYRKWQQMKMPEWAHLEMEEIDFQVRILQAIIAEFHWNYIAWVDFELF